MDVRLVSLTVILLAAVITGDHPVFGQEPSTKPPPKISREAPAPESNEAEEAQKAAGPAAAPGGAAAGQGAGSSRPEPPQRLQSQTGSRSRRLLARRQCLMYRLTRVPDLFGDSLVSGEFISGGDLARFPFRDRNKIADNGHVVPQDRQYADYRHYANSAELVGGTRRSEDTNRYRLGIERLFGTDSNWSVEVRLPLTSHGGFTAPTSVDTDGIGNLSVIAKRTLRQTETSVVSAGLGVTLPTGEDLRLGTALGNVEIESNAVHLQPFVGFLSTPNDDCFFQSFVQLDVPARGNSVSGGGVGGGRLNEKTKLYVDAQVGKWLFRHAVPRQGLRPTGLAAILELHYTRDMSADNDAAVVPGIGTVATFFDRRDVLNLTTGFHGELGPDTAVRFAVGVPLTKKLNRDFDAEFIVTLVRRI